jgi:hypothetical protein
MLEKTIERRPNSHKAEARQPGCLDGDTPSPSTSSEFITHTRNMRWRAMLGGRGHDIVILGNKRNL